MIIGAHVLFYSTNADADRAFLRDTFAFPSVDVGGGWLIFALPPAEVAVHPTAEAFGMSEHGKSMLGSILYLMCDDVDAEITQLTKRGVSCAPVAQERWGRRTSFTLPSGQEMGLYQPLHPTAIQLREPARKKRDRRGTQSRTRRVRQGRSRARRRAR
jgi:hypothetical protein